jgi:hypothetical protein
VWKGRIQETQTPNLIPVIHGIVLIIRNDYRNSVFHYLIFKPFNMPFKVVS